ncbi:MAG: acetate--CoA ligase family protein [Deltaproteobacteria bacterium]|nr:acetate--CoA ligase family protein [Deltaproteobacteria bacterium]
MPTILDEVSSKQLLASYGVPGPLERRADSPAAAAAAAQELGFPVVLKGMAEGVAHKSERELVQLGLADAASVEQAARRMRERAGIPLAGFVVQQRVPGRRELLLGLIRDRQFGPALVLGHGGVLAEALADAAFALVPLVPADVDDLIASLRCAPLFEEVRGEPAVDRRALGELLSGLSRLAQERPDVAEVDLNPVLVRPDGSLCAVDAVVVLRDPGPEPARRPSVPPRRLGRLFAPGSVAVAGVSANPTKWGFFLLSNLVAGEFPGPIELVSTAGGRIAGRTVHRSIAEMPAEVDTVVITVPAAAVGGVLEDMHERGVRGAVVISSGFSETGDQGRQLERALVARARELGITLIGPNTMGICNPLTRFFATGVHVRPLPGSTALVAQSGNFGVQLLAFAEEQGIGIRAYCGSGNEAMVSVEDFLEAFEVDEATRQIVLYIESLKDPTRFFSCARRLSRHKPIIVLKGGRTSAGNRAAASHTGALAGDTRLFSAACRQAGVIEVPQPLDLLDLSAAFSSLPLPRGDRVAILTMGGGWGVIAADLCQERGLTVPVLSPEVVAAFDALLPPYWSRQNPVDLVGQFVPALSAQGVATLARWDGCDAVIHLGMVGQVPIMRWLADSVPAVLPEMSQAELDGLVQGFTDAEAAYHDHVIALMRETRKPIIGVSLVDRGRRTLHGTEGADALRSVVFPTPERAVSVLAAMQRLTVWRARRA